MSDDQIDFGLRTYANELQRTAQIVPAAEIRRRGDRRRRNRAVGASFALVLIAAIGAGTLLNRHPQQPVIPPGPSPSISPSTAKSILPSYQPATSTRSDVSQLRQFGIDLQAAVLIDVADDGEDHWMQTGQSDVVDFTGTKRDDSTRMSLQPAPVTARRRRDHFKSATDSAMSVSPPATMATSPHGEGRTKIASRIAPSRSIGSLRYDAAVAERDEPAGS